MSKRKSKKLVKVKSGFDGLKPVLDEFDDDGLFGEEQISKIKPDVDGIFDDESTFDLPLILKSKNDLTIEYTRLTCDSDPNPKRYRTNFESFAKRMEKPRPCGDLSLKELLKRSNDQTNKQSSSSNRSRASFIPGTFGRKNTTDEKYMSARYLLVLEVYDGFYNLKSLTRKLKRMKLECVVYKSFLHSESKNIFTVCIPFNKPITQDIEETCSRALSWFKAKLGDHINPRCWRVNQSYCLPSCPPDAVNQYKAIRIEGKPFRIANFSIEQVDYKRIQAGCTPADNRVVEDYNSRGNWGELLLLLGYVYSFTGNYARDYYTGKKMQQNAILGTLYPDLNVFWVEAKSKIGGSLITGRAYSLFEAYAKISHNGDEAAATRALKLKGYGEPKDLSQPVAVYDLSAREMAEKMFPSTKFPMKIFRKDFRELVTSSAKANQCPVDVMMLVMLTALSAAIGNSVALQIKEGWDTALFIWSILIDNTGAGKTHPIDSALKPILKLQASKGSISLSNKLEYKRHYYAQSPSIESLIGIYNESSRGILIHPNEISCFFDKMNPNKNKKVRDYGNLNSLFECKPLFTDGKSVPLGCWESGAAIIGGMSPSRFHEVFNKDLHDNGLAYRFLPLPFNLGSNKFSDAAITKEHEELWSTILTWAYNIPTTTDPATRSIIKSYLTVEPDGKEFFGKFYDDINRSQYLMPEELKGYLPKLITYCLKFSGLLHLLNCYPNYEEISLPVKSSIIKGAIQLAKYYAGQALKLTSEREPVEDPYMEQLKKCLFSLKSEVKNGKLLRRRVHEVLNSHFPARLSINSKQLGVLLKRLNLNVKVGTNNKSEVILDDELFLENFSTGRPKCVFKREY